LEIPTKWKRNCIIAAFHRAKSISSDFNNAIKTIEKSLLNAGYTKCFISQRVNRSLNDSPVDDVLISSFLFEEHNKVFIKLPYCNNNEKP